MRITSSHLFLCTISAILLSSSACEFEPSHRGVSPVSGALQVTEDDRLLVLAAEDHDAVLVMSRESGDILHRVSVSKGPSHVVARDGRAVVTTRYGHRVEVIDLESGRLQHSIAVGVEPTGLTFLDENRVAVALSGEQALAVVHLEEERVEKKVPLAIADPRAVAQTADGRIWVTHMSEGVMTVIAPDTHQTQMVRVETAIPDTLLEAEHLRSLTLSPDGQRLLMAHSQANTQPVREAFAGFEADADSLSDEDASHGFDTAGDPFACAGYDGCPGAGELPAVVPGITEVDVQVGVVVTPGSETGISPGARGSSMSADPSHPAAVMPGQGAVPGILNPNESRFRPFPMNNPTAMALFAGGRGMAVLQMGSRNVLFLRRAMNGSDHDVWGTANVGHGASSLAIRHDGLELFVWNQFDGTITSLMLSDLPPDAAGASRFSTEGTHGGMHQISHVSKTWKVVEDALPPQVSLGRKLFHDAQDPRISSNGTISCATCHPDGRTDGRTWSFTFGPRNTPQLGGGILSTAPFHWPGDVRNVQALNHMTVQAFMGGEGLDNASMDALAAFIDQIPSAPTRSGMLAVRSDAAERGRVIFESAETGCTACHSGAHFTDNLAWDIGSAARVEGMDDIDRFQTPVLHGLARSAPYFHDGSLSSLEELVEKWVRSDKMGMGSHLSDDEAADLVAYLKSL